MKAHDWKLYFVDGHVDWYHVWQCSGCLAIGGHGDLFYEPSRDKPPTWGFISGGGFGAKVPMDDCDKSKGMVDAFSKKHRIKQKPYDPKDLVSL